MNNMITHQMYKPNSLRQFIIPWSIYISGARDMLLRLRHAYLLDETHETKTTSEEKVINKAIIDFVLSSKQNMDDFLTEHYEIRLTDHQYDKRGKLIKCRAYFDKPNSPQHETSMD